MKFGKVVFILLTILFVNSPASQAVPLPSRRTQMARSALTSLSFRRELYRDLIKGNLDGRMISFTFDDGPHPVMTERLLKILKRYHVKATFFIVGEMAEKHPELVKQIYEDGHEVGNHTYHHVNLARVSESTAAYEFQACNDVIQSLLGIEAKYCRPPGGNCTPAVVNAAVSQGLAPVMWTSDPADYAMPGAGVIKQRILRAASPGGIILLHSGIEQTMEILPEVIGILRSRGYEFATVDQMVKCAQQSQAVRYSQSPLRRLAVD